MSDTPPVEEVAAARELLELTRQHAFGPFLFLGQLAAYVRERCPDRTEALPHVELRLHDGTAIDVCHVIGVGPRWAAIAARDPGAKGRMETVLLPYESIARVVIRAQESRDHNVGFEQHHAPAILVDDASSAERALRAAAKRPPTDG